MRSFLCTIAALVGAAQAIRFSYPTAKENSNSTSTGIVLTKGDTVKVTWDAVDTDPKTFSLYLWEFASWPPTYEAVAYNVSTQDKQTSFTIPCHVFNSNSWQLTMIKGTNVYVVWAQTGNFTIRDAPGECKEAIPQPHVCASSSSMGVWDFTTYSYTKIDIDIDIDIYINAGAAAVIPATVTPAGAAGPGSYHPPKVESYKRR